MSQSQVEPGPVESPPPAQAIVARLEDSSYQNRIAETQAALEQQAVERAKDETVWEAENNERLEKYKQGTEFICLSHSRIRTLRGFQQHLIRLAPTLKQLILRQNLIPKLKLPEIIPVSISEEPQQIGLDNKENDQKEKENEKEEKEEKEGKEEKEQVFVSPFDSLEFLEDLDIYDNRISKIEGLDQLHSLKSLDLSFNLIRKIENLESLKSLSTLYLIQNKISQIEGLDALGDKLTSLELGSNRIREINNLDNLTNLTELWLGKNKITKLGGLSTLVNLSVLSIQSNRIIKLEGLEKLVNLEELYMSHNGLTSIGDGLKENKKLKVLDVGANRINDVSGISGLENLEEFWANDNKISMKSWNGVADNLSEKFMPNLNTIYLQGNPVQVEMGANYRRKIVLACPQIVQVDATYVKPETNKYID